ncbi:oxidoreductase [Amedibacterium intestinale]|uniref:oxidoreductase n=1 Tax=Amedibacterium intestinale TaxID=2583452 RepID=UPI000E4D7CDD|nr:oxidoreductase [Amedibacterium intestinale]RHO18031.1 oxidoreductase [Eubacterium sp. AM18-26]RHO21994.1 oxidoreductase [Eubacterium sp. AM18-10LB-B]RHO28553.1 oxidoreductase [Erysipelotrichaceae bacterium AM17-60]BBK62706.1 hypothetical protein A9CBEGH2_16460 [Amedibacterium intestinale]
MHQIDVSDTMLTSKDILYMQDLLDQTFVLYKRIQHESTLLQTKEIITCFQKTEKQLCKNYKQLVSILQEEVKK